MEPEKKSKPKSIIFIRILLCALVLMVGAAGMIGMAKMKKPPAEAVLEEQAIKVEVLGAEPEDIRVVVKGFGEVRPLNIVPVVPEVSGKVVEIHPALEIGENVRKGELLFKVDPRNYDSAYKDAKARVSQGENTVKRLKKEYKLDKERLKTVKRNRELAKAEYKRLKRLFEKDRVGTRSGVEKAEQAYNAAQNQADILEQGIEIFPIRILEAQASLESAKAQAETAGVNLERCRVLSPFNGRIKEAGLEAGQYVVPGQKVLILADDSILEIHVSIDSRDAKQWLQFDNIGFDNIRLENDKDQKASAAWFPGLNRVQCSIRWTEDREGSPWQGKLHRVVEFDPQTRTMTLAVRVKAGDAAAKSGLPLVEGMFCSVEIPGKTVQNVVRLPRWSVTYKNTVYISENNRLKTVPVKVARVEAGQALVAHGISPGDKVIITRLVDPLENQLLEIINKSPGEIPDMEKKS